MIRRVLLIAALVLAGCQQDAGDGSDLPAVGEAAVEQARQACERKGGRFGPAGRSQSMVCFTIPRDAGKACERSTDCSSTCLARSRTCAPVTPMFGCNEILNEDGARLTQCID
jgi:hypothetical protein